MSALQADGLAGELRAGVETQQAYAPARHQQAVCGARVGLPELRAPATREGTRDDGAVHAAMDHPIGLATAIVDVVFEDDLVGRAANDPDTERLIEASGRCGGSGLRHGGRS